MPLREPHPSELLLHEAFDVLRRIDKLVSYGSYNYHSDLENDIGYLKKVLDGVSVEFDKERRPR